MISNGNGKLQEPRVLIAQQKHHINTMNRMIWLLVAHAGGEVRINRERMKLMSETWTLDIHNDEATSEVVFRAGDRKKVNSTPS